RNSSPASSSTRCDSCRCGSIVRSLYAGPTPNSAYRTYSYDDVDDQQEERQRTCDNSSWPLGVASDQFTELHNVHCSSQDPQERYDQREDEADFRSSECDQPANNQDHSEDGGDQRCPTGKGGSDIGDNPHNDEECTGSYGGARHLEATPSTRGGNRF